MSYTSATAAAPSAASLALNDRKAKESSARFFAILTKVKDAENKSVPSPPLDKGELTAANGIEPRDVCSS